MTELAFRDVPVDGAALRVGTCGTGPVVLGIHGITASSVSLQPVARLVARSRTFVAPDLRGRGGSADAPGPYGIEAHARDCAALIETLGSGPAVVAGHSMGGYVAAVLAATRPDLVERIVLIDGGLPLPLPEGDDLDIDAVMDALLGPSLARLKMTFESRDAYVDFWRAHPSLTADWNDDVEVYVTYDLVGDPPALRSCVSEEAVRADGRDTLANADLIVGAATSLTCPVHLLRAPRGILNDPTPLLPDVLVDHWRNVLPELTVETVEDTNHFTIALAPEGAAIVAERVLHGR